MSINRAQIMGNVGAEPDVRFTRSGKKVCNLSVATNRKYKDRDGNEQSLTQWHRVVVFGDALIENVVEKYVRKGSGVYLEGELNTRNWIDQAGATRYITEIVVGFNSIFRLTGAKPDNGRRDDTVPPANRDAPPAADLDDDIPF